jgi:hypothetical protein
MLSGTYICLILTKASICRQILLQPPSIKFHENPFTDSQSVACVQLGRSPERI